MKFVYVAATLALVAVIAIVIAVNSGGAAAYDSFATCISDSGMKFYGAYWCPHCIQQKEMFGKSADKLPYVECSLPNNAGQTAECARAGITSYPTWELPDGKRVQGTLTLQELSSISGCPLNQTA